MGFSEEIGDGHLMEHKKSMEQLSFINKGRRQSHSEVVSEDVVKNCVNWRDTRDEGLQLFVLYSIPPWKYQGKLRMRSSKAEHEVRPNQKEDHGVKENSTLYCLPLPKLFFWWCNKVICTLHWDFHIILNNYFPFADELIREICTGTEQTISVLYN